MQIIHKASLVGAISGGLALAATAMQNINRASRVAADNFRMQGNLFVSNKKRLGRKPAPRGYTDKAGMPHGTSGDKLRRKSLTGTVSLIGSKRGWLQSWSSSKVARLGLGDRRRKHG